MRRNLRYVPVAFIFHAFVASASQLPTDTEIRAAYCLAPMQTVVMQSNLNAAIAEKTPSMSAAKKAEAARDVRAATTDLEKLNAYLRPRFIYMVDSEDLAYTVAMNDAVQRGRNAVQELSTPGDHSGTRSKMNVCFRLDWLPF